MYFVLSTGFSLAVGQLDGKLDRVWRTSFRVLVVAGFCVTLLVRSSFKEQHFCFSPKITVTLMATLLRERSLI